MDADPNGWEALGRAHGALVEELTASGELITTHELDSDNGKVVGTRNDRVVVTDGPFSEGKEIVGGFYLLQCESLDRAVEIASRLEEITFSVVDVRPILRT
jgi:hypothetical protein